MSDAELLAAARDLVRCSHDLEARLLVHLAEIDERKLYLEGAYPSMFAYCVGELGLSEDAAYNRIGVARAGRRFPAVLEAIRDGSVHLWGMRLLTPHLTEANHRNLIAQAAGKTKRGIEELLASLAPRAPVASMVRSIPQRAGLTQTAPLMASDPPSVGDPAAPTVDAAELSPSGPQTHTPPAAPAPRFGPAVVPLAAQTYLVKFTAGRSFWEKLRQAKDLMRHRVPGGDLETIFEAALEVLIEQVEKERFGVRRRPRGGGVVDANASVNGGGVTADQSANGHAGVAANGVEAGEVPASARVSPSVAPPANSGVAASLAAAPGAEPVTAASGRPGGDDKRRGASRHVPAAMRRAVYKRDGGRCTFVDAKGRRCTETGQLEIDHVDGFAETGKHDIKKLRVLCRAHNQREAEKRYGKAFMASARKSHAARSTRSGTSRRKR